ncbi:hypothetical protein BC827DRAFT_1333354 [Russula dissimulans]|nr:hypothetical protein BC827DRAFT_1333354 [Russula dissimulans]
MFNCVAHLQIFCYTSSVSIYLLSSLLLNDPSILKHDPHPLSHRPHNPNTTKNRVDKHITPTLVKE